MATDLLYQPSSVHAEVDLTVLGYADGSHAQVVINPTKAWRKAWLAIDEIERGEDETFASLQERQDAALMPLVPYVVESVTLVSPNGTDVVKVESVADAEGLENRDPRILALIIGEAYERGQVAVLDGRRTFRNERRKLLVPSSEIQSGNAADSEASAGDDVD